MATYTKENPLKITITNIGAVGRAWVENDAMYLSIGTCADTQLHTLDVWRARGKELIINFALSVAITLDGDTLVALLDGNKDVAVKHINDHIDKLKLDKPALFAEIEDKYNLLLGVLLFVEHVLTPQRDAERDAMKRKKKKKEMPKEARDKIKR